MEPTACLLSRLFGDPSLSLPDRQQLCQLYTIARTLGIMEGLSPTDQQQLEMAALLYASAAPALRAQSGWTSWSQQDQLCMQLARDLLELEDIDPILRQRVLFLVGHVHDWDHIQGMDWQILTETCLIAQALDSGYLRMMHEELMDTVFVTPHGRQMFRALLPAVPDA